MGSGAAKWQGTALNTWLKTCYFSSLRTELKRHLPEQNLVDNLIYIPPFTTLLSVLAQFYFSSVQFSRSVVSDSLRPHESQHARPPCPSPTPKVHSDSRPSSQWCHPAISSSVIPSPPAPNPSQHQSLFPWVFLLSKSQTVTLSTSLFFWTKSHKGKFQLYLGHYWSPTHKKMSENTICAKSISWMNE